MNTLAELNNYSSEFLTVNDDRDFSIAFSQPSVSNLDITVSEGISYVPSFGVYVLEIISASDLSLTIDVSNLPGATLSWPAGLSAGTTFSNPATGVYVASGFSTNSDWSKLTTETLINQPRDNTTAHTISMTFEYPTSQSIQWTNTVTVTDTAELATPVDCDFDPGFANNLLAPLILDLENTTGTYSITITPPNTSRVSLMQSSGVGGTFNYNPTTTITTITGTKTQVNSHLSTLVMTTTAESSVFSLLYQLTNPVSNVVTYKSQTMRSNLDAQDLINADIARTYNENTVALLFSQDPVSIIHESLTPIVYKIILTLSSNVGSIHLVNNNLGWDETARTYTISGTKNQVNDALSQVYFFPNADTTTAFTLNTKMYFDDVLKSSVDGDFTAIPFVGSYPEIYRVFNSVGTFTLDVTLEQLRYMDCDLTIIGGGGGGGGGTAANGNNKSGGGGGAGGVKKYIGYTGFKQIEIDTDITIGVGAGGLGIPNNSDTSDYTTYYNNATGKNSYININDLLWQQVVSTESGSYTTVGIRKDNTMWAWGQDSTALGLNFDVGEQLPALQIPGYWTSVQAGQGFFAAIKTDGTLWTWGSGGAHLGLNNYSSVDQPTQVGTSTWTSVVCGINFMIGIKTDGTLWSWGNNFYGTLGLGDTTVRLVPTQIGVDNNWVQASAGGQHAGAINTLGEVWLWGNNRNSQAGQPSYVLQSDSPYRSRNAGGSFLSCGDRHTLVLETDGSLIGTGADGDWQLGFSGTTTVNGWVSLATGQTWTYINAGGNQSMAINQVGEIFSTGKGHSTELGPTVTKTGWSKINSLPALNFTQAHCGWQYNTCHAIAESGELYSSGPWQDGFTGQTSGYDWVRTGGRLDMVIGGGYGAYFNWGQQGPTPNVGPGASSGGAPSDLTISIPTNRWLASQGNSGGSVGPAGGGGAGSPGATGQGGAGIQVEVYGETLEVAQGGGVYGTAATTYGSGGAGTNSNGANGQPGLVLIRFYKD